MTIYKHKRHESSLKYEPKCLNHPRVQKSTAIVPVLCQQYDRVTVEHWGYDEAMVIMLTLR